MNTEAQLPCLQCGEPVAASGRYCSLCGAELYARCPRCEQAREAGDQSCRTCGFDFKIKKLRLRDPIAPAPAAAPSDGEPILTIHQMLPGADRRRQRAADVAAGRFLRGAVSLVLVLAAGALVADWGWTRVTGRNLIAVLLGAGSSGTEVSPGDQEPDWEALCAKRREEYRGQFSPPLSNTQIAVITTAGVRKQGTMVALEPEAVRLQVGEQQLEFARQVLIPETRYRLFAEDYAGQKVDHELAASKAAWSSAMAARAEARKAAPLWDPRSSLVANGLEWGRRLVSGDPAPELPAWPVLPLQSPLSAPAESTGSVPPQVPARPSVEPAAVRDEADREPTAIDLSCPACQGRGVLMFQRRDGESRGKLAAPPQNVPCPVCQGRGGRHIAPPDYPWPAGAERCRTCGGMGHVLKQETRRGSMGASADRPLAALCPECTGRGYLVNPVGAARRTPPRYE